MSGDVLGWAEVSPKFGAALPNGSCNALVADNYHGVLVCGFPRRADGTCLQGHPAQPAEAPAPTDKCWRHYYGHREYVCLCTPHVPGDCGRDTCTDCPAPTDARPWAGCTGAGDCPGPWHVHGCYADRGQCDDPTDHLPAPTDAREALARVHALLDERDDLARDHVEEYESRHPGNKAGALVTTAEVRAALSPTAPDAREALADSQVPGPLLFLVREVRAERDAAREALARVERWGERQEVLYPSKFANGVVANYVAGYRAALADFRAVLAPTTPDAGPVDQVAANAARGYDCQECRGTGQVEHNDLPDGSAMARTCLACDGTGRTTPEAQP